ncbi:MAG: non-ribosomal peptide synthetase, partial [Acidobacteriota bacterium]
LRLAALARWNDTVRPFTSEASVHALISTWAVRTPRAPAMVWGDEILTYGALDSAANRLAQHLIRRGWAGPDRRIGLRMARSPLALVAMLSVLKAGAAYVVLDDDPASATRHGVGAVLTADPSDGRAPDVTADAGVAHLDLMRDAAQIGSAPAEMPASAAMVAGDDVAYVTAAAAADGVDDRVHVIHRSIVSLALSAFDALPAGGRVGQDDALDGPATTLEVWGTLIRGGAIIGLSSTVFDDADAFVAQMQAQPLERLWLSTRRFCRLAAQRADAFAQIGELLIGGDGFDPESVARVLAAAPPQIGMRQIYTPPAAGGIPVCATTFVPHDAWADDIIEPLGTPLANVRAYVVNDAFEPMPLGVPGGLVIGGVAVGPGARAGAGRDAGRLVPDPFADVPGTRMIRTGDVVRRRPDGRLVRVGRDAARIVLRGVRVDLDALAQPLRRLPAVEDAHVVAETIDRDAPQASTRLVVYLAAPRVDEEAVRAELAHHVPAIEASTAALVRVDALPIDRAGAVQSAQLQPAPPAARRADAPRTYTEMRMVALWRQVLDVDAVGIHDDFFARGGQTLGATRLVTRIADAFDVALPLQQVVELATPAAMAAAVDGLRGVDAADAGPPPLAALPR